LTKSCSLELTEELDAGDTTMRQYRYIHVIATHEQLTYSAFAEILGVSKPSVTEIVKQLMKQKIVEKHQCTRDGRIYYIELTDKGRQLSNSKCLTNEKIASSIIMKLTETEVRTLIHLLRKIGEWQDIGSGLFVEQPDYFHI